MRKSYQIKPLILKFDCNISSREKKTISVIIKVIFAYLKRNELKIFLCTISKAAQAVKFNYVYGSRISTKGQISMGLTLILFTFCIYDDSNPKLPLARYENSMINGQTVC